MAYFEAKMHQIRFGWGLRPIPGRGAYSAPPGTPAGFQGPTSEGKEGREKDLGESRVLEEKEDKKKMGNKGRGVGGLLLREREWKWEGKGK